MSARVVVLSLGGVLVVVLLAVFALTLSGEDMSELWGELVLPVAVLAVCFGLLWLGFGLSAALRIRNRRRRALGRYQLVLSQADEATFEEVAAAYEQLVQTVRESLTERFADGQPWFALESWFVPAGQVGETGVAALMLLCEPHTREHAMASLRRAFPDVSLRPDPAAADGSPLEFVQPGFVPGHVLRVKKTRSWALAVGSVGRLNEGSNARSTMAGIIRQQQQAGRLSCVRWCVLPAADQLDSRAAQKLEGFAGRGPNAAHSADVSQALQSAGGAMSFLELQAAVEQREVSGRRGRERPESFSELQNVCRQLLSPALSQRGANHLTERLMVFRQGLYRRRWARAEPPLVPDPSGCTLVSPRELALLMELPSLGSEHALPLQRNTVPHLPTPTEVPRARQPALELPLDGGADSVGEDEAGDEEIIDAELVLDQEPNA